jgi:serine/threonine protein kinase
MDGFTAVTFTPDSIPARSAFSQDSILYSAPELIECLQGGNITLSVAADMFSYAGVFFNMLFKEHTWPKDSKPADVLKQIKAGQRPKIPQDLLEKEDMKWIVDIIQGCWKLDPTERPSATSVFKTICLNREKKYKE